MINLTVTDIKQYINCPRIVFFTYFLSLQWPEAEPAPEYQERSRCYQIILEKLEHRRKLGKYHLDEGERVFQPALTSSRLGLSGQPDMIVKSSEGLFPVEFSDTTAPKPSKSSLYPLTAYALLLEDISGVQVSQGFVYLLALQDVEVFHVTGELKEEVLKLVSSIREMLQKERLPGQTKNRGQCTGCTYQNFCADVW
ncbi:MAG: CRISPR-associated protein Cas4 [bacterium]